MIESNPSPPSRADLFFLLQPVGGASVIVHSAYCWVLFLLFFFSSFLIGKSCKYKSFVGQGLCNKVSFFAFLEYALKPSGDSKWILSKKPFCSAFGG